MRMTTPRLLLLRLYNVTLGRSAAFSALLRRLLVWMVIDKAREGKSYAASSRFFDPRELDGDDKG